MRTFATDPVRHPVPATNGKLGNPVFLVFPFRTMAVGESFTVSAALASSVSVACSILSRNTEKAFIAKRLKVDGERMIRCWRIS